jgi:hypothetical protein
VKKLQQSESPFQQKHKHPCMVLLLMQQQAAVASHIKSIKSPKQLPTRYQLPHKHASKSQGCIAWSLEPSTETGPSHDNLTLSHKSPPLPSSQRHPCQYPAHSPQCTHILGGSESALRLLLSMLQPYQYAAACELAQ